MLLLIQAYVWWLSGGNKNILVSEMVVQPDYEIYLFYYVGPAKVSLYWETSVYVRIYRPDQTWW